MIDLRSDTVTRPSAAMLDAMMNAKVGDDVFGDDESVIALEEYAAAMFGMEKGLFCTSGTMSNQLAIMAQTAPADELICHKYAHVYKYEGGGIASNAHVSVRLLDGDRGMITAEAVLENINNRNDIHLPISSIVTVENTMNKGGGAIYDLAELKKIGQLCKEKGLRYHMDGARIFNAMVETGESAMEFGNLFDSISICLSKGLGAPMGSILLGSAETVLKAKRIRKRMGGGWRQAGYMAAAGLYALQNNVQRLKEDHVRAQKMGEIMVGQSYVKGVLPIQTNIVIVELKKNIDQLEFLNKLSSNGVMAVGFGPQLIRFVTHLDFKDSDLTEFIEIINKIGH